MLPTVIQLPSPDVLLGQLRPNISLDPRTNILLGTVLGFLLIAYFVGWALRRQPESTASPAVVRTFNNRVRAWLFMYTVLLAGLVMGYVMTVVLFGLISFWALREFITMTPTRRGDHRTLLLTFLFAPLQFVLVGIGHELYGLYTVMIPVYASLLVPTGIAISGDPKRFLERAAKIQAGLMICVYCLSHAPAILDLQLTTGRHGKPWVLVSAPPASTEETEAKAEPASNETPQSPATPDPRVLGSNVSVLFFFLLIVQLNDVFQYMWTQLLGKSVIAPQINASRTWEGLVGGVLSSMLLGLLLSWATPFSYWAGPIAGIVALAGFAGSMTMSGIKRDRGVKDYGTLVSGHAGVLDRIDSLCFAAPVFFHITRYFFSAG
jgi:phosphatidate cytidylyltransferase